MHLYILLLILLTCCITFTEHHYNYQYPVTISSRSTRNMSYDIRCVPKITKNQYLWNYSGREPQQYGKCVNIV